MMRNLSFALVFFWLVSSVQVALGQEYTRSQFDSIYASFVDSRFSDPNEDLLILKQLENHLFKLKDTCRLARVNSWKRNCYDATGQLDSSVFFGHLALRLFVPNCDSLTLMSINVNLTSTYLSLEEYDKVIQIADKSLADWNSSWPKTKTRTAFYTNKAIAQVYKGDWELGLVTFKELLKLALIEQNKIDQMDASNNISALFGMLYELQGDESKLDSSLKYINTALLIGKELKAFESVLIHYLNLAGISKDKGDYAQCLVYLDSSTHYANRGDYLQHFSRSARIRSDAYEGLGELDSSLFYLRLHYSLKDSILDKDKVRAITDMQEKYASEKKERQIKELQVNQLNSELRETQLTKTRNIYLFGGLSILLIAGGLWSRLRDTRRSKAVIQQEKDRSEELLLNILPEEVAKELKDKGEAEAQFIDNVTILFTDFKGFTALSEKLTPKELVAICTIAFQCLTKFARITVSKKSRRLVTPTWRPVDCPHQTPPMPKMWF